MHRKHGMKKLKRKETIIKKTKQLQLFTLIYKIVYRHSMSPSRDRLHNRNKAILVMEQLSANKNEIFLFLEGCNYSCKTVLHNSATSSDPYRQVKKTVVTM